MPIQLPPEVYWEFRARLRDAELALVDLQKAGRERWRDDKEILTMLQNRLEEACAARALMSERLKADFGMSPALSYRWDDSTCTLHEETG